MSSDGTKRARLDGEGGPQHGGGGGGGGLDIRLQERQQIYIKDGGLRDRLGKMYVDQSELLTLLREKGYIEDRSTCGVIVEMLDGDNGSKGLYIRTAADPDGSEIPPGYDIKKQLEEELDGVLPQRQSLYKIQKNVDGSAVRDEPDKDPMLVGAGCTLQPGDRLTVCVAPEPQWLVHDEATTAVGPGAWYPGNSYEVVQTVGRELSLTHTGQELTEGFYHWRVHISAHDTTNIYVGVCRPDVNAREFKHCMFQGEHEDDCFFVLSDKAWMLSMNKFNTADLSSHHTFDVILNLRYGLLEFYDDDSGERLRVGNVTGLVVLAVTTYLKNQTVDLMEPIFCNRLPDYKDLGHGFQ
jgi:hypothetical protein